MPENNNVTNLDNSVLAESNNSIIKSVDPEAPKKRIPDYVVGANGEQRSVVRLSEVKFSIPPLKPLPEDSVADVYYTSKFESKCALCTAPEDIRTRAEHWYIEKGTRPHAVHNFLIEYYAINASWECIDKHMREHCQLTGTIKRGLVSVTQFQAEINKYKYKELELAIDTYLMFLDKLISIDTSKNPDLLLRTTQRIESLSKALLEATKRRDEAGLEIMTPFKVCRELYDRMPDKASKEVINRYTELLREKLMSGE